MTLNESVSLRTEGVIAEALIDNPPVNAMSASVRAGLRAVIERFEGDAALEALILRCEGKSFVAGADIKEFGKPMTPPLLPDVLKSIDAARKPVIAAVHGTVLGGGLELALACHYRIAATGTKFGFPEVKLGLFPGAGGTQRLPRLAGLAVAIRMITAGEPIDTDAAQSAGLVDEVAADDLKSAAHAFAASILAAGKGPRRSGELPMPPDDPELFEEARKTIRRTWRGHSAPLKALEVIRLGYEMPFEQAVSREYEMCREAVRSPQSQGLRHIFAAEREVARIPGLPKETGVREIRAVGVVGLGVMGRGILMAVVAAGVPVTAVGLDQARLDAAREAVYKLWAASTAKGNLTRTALEERMRLIKWSLTAGDLADVDLVIEAVTEDIAAKRDVFAMLGRVMRAGAILASNTSYLDINMLGEASGRPADVCGMHFFNPASVMRLLENVRSRTTAPDVIATVMAFGKRLGKLPVLSAVCDGFIVNRLLAKRSRESYFLLEEGATPEAIDAVVVEFGFPIGPYALADLAGIDVQYAARRARCTRLTPREARTDFVEQMYASGRYGQKSGAGWYNYDGNRKASHAPETDAIIAAHAAKHGLQRRDIGAEEIRERLLYAMVNEGAKLLDEGIVPRPHEIDVAMVNGVGFPAYTGGPLFWADQVGLAKVLASIEGFRAAHGDEYWSPAALLVQLVHEGRGFYT